MEIYMVKRYRTASSRIEIDVYDAYFTACKLLGITPNTELKQHIEGVIKNVRSKSEEISKRDNSGRNEETELASGRIEDLDA